MRRNRKDWNKEGRKTRTQRMGAIYRVRFENQVKEVKLYDNHDIDSTCAMSRGNFRLECIENTSLQQVQHN